MRRLAESIGKHVEEQVLDEIESGATLDRFAADQIILFTPWHLVKADSSFLLRPIMS